MVDKFSFIDVSNGEPFTSKRIGFRYMVKWKMTGRKLERAWQSSLSNAVPPLWFSFFGLVLRVVPHRVQSIKTGSTSEIETKSVVWSDVEQQNSRVSLKTVTHPRRQFRIAFVEDVRVLAVIAFCLRKRSLRVITPKYRVRPDWSRVIENETNEIQVEI